MARLSVARGGVTPGRGQKASAGDLPPSVQHALARGIDAKDHGAVGDNVADDTTAIQAAHDAAVAAGVWLILAPGTYACKQLRLASTARVWGYGAKLTRTAAPGTGFEGEMLGNSPGTTTTIQVLGLELADADTTHRTIVFHAADGLLLRDVHVSQHAGVTWAAWFINCTNSLIDSYRQSTGGVKQQDGLHFSGGSNVTVSNPRIHSGDDCISLTLSDIDGHSGDMTGFVINGGTLVSDQGRTVNLSCTNTDGAAIRKVTIGGHTGTSSPPGGVNSRGFCINGNSSNNIVDVQVDNVTVDCSANASGNNSTPGVDITNVVGAVLSNVKVLGAAGSSFNVQTCTDVTLTACIGKNPQGTAVNFVAFGAPNTRFIGCKSINGKSSDWQIGSGTNSSNSCLLSGCEASGSPGNSVYLHNTAGTRVIGCSLACTGNAVVEDSTCDRNVISGNDVSGATTPFVQIVGASTRVSDNPGLNPVGTVAVGVPVTGSAPTAQPYDRMFYVTAAAGGLTLAVGGGPTVTVPALALATVRLRAGRQMTYTYTNSPSQVVEGL